VTVPESFVGAWRRSGLLLNGRRVVDYSDVIWLQTPEWFADMRVLIDPGTAGPRSGVPGFFYDEFAFSGTSSWDGRVFAWHHHIDRSSPPPSDANPVSFEDGVAVERGTAEADGVPVTFAEEWLRMTADGVEWSEEHSDGWARVEVGGFAVELRDDRRGGGPFTATRYARDGGRWVRVASITPVG
jgi:hypothetical protein